MKNMNDNTQQLRKEYSQMPLLESEALEIGRAHV